MRPGCNYEGRPVTCLVPEADKKRFAMLSGDPEVTSMVSEATAVDVGALIAVLLSGLDPRERRRAISIALSKCAPGQLDIVPMSALMPRDATTEQLAALWNGLMLQLLALGSASADTSVGSVVANASAMGSGTPFASDPMVGERQNEVLLAKAMLEAALLGDEEAQKWFQDNKLADALAMIAKSAPGGKSDVSDEFVAAADYLNQLYDCAVHDKPLGGDAMAGSIMTDFLEDAWDRVKNAAGRAVSGVGRAISGATAEGVTESKAVEPDVIGSVQTVSNATESVRSGVEAAKKALDEAREALEAGNENISTYKAKLKETALQSAKLEWAQAILDADDEVAAILAATTPNMSDPGTFLQSMLATLPAAKETGNLGTIKALVYALRSAASKGDGSANSLYSLIASDPSAIIGDASKGEASSAALANQKMVLNNLCM